MSDDKVRTRVETLEEPVSRALAHARRAELWAGLNRYTDDEATGARGSDARAGEARSTQHHHE
jgi:hypothetical protein